jgi:hypothetical protein
VVVQLPILQATSGGPQVGLGGRFACKGDLIVGFFSQQQVLLSIS